MANGIEPLRKITTIKISERVKLARQLKKLDLKIDTALGFNQSMVTRGGVNLKEVDPKTMRSKIFPNLFFAGEILDLDGPTGGYNLQIAWTTGQTAGNAAAENLNSD
jgi:predicted flavoprotein YhiN